MVMAWWGNQVRNEKTQEALDKYKELNDVTVEGQFYQWNDYWSKMATAAAGNSMPDLIQMDYSYIDQYVENGQLLDLTPYIESGALDVSNIPDNVLQMGVVGDGNYGIAAGVSGNCLFYNKTVTDEAGVTIKDNMTYDEFVEIAKTVTEKTGYRAKLIQDVNYMGEWARAEGIPIVEAKMPVDSADAYVPFFQMVADGIEEGWHLTPENIVERGENLTFPDSAVSYFKGMMGQPRWGFPKELQRVVLKGETPITCRPGELLLPMDFDAARERLKQFVPKPDWRMVISWCFYPKVVEDFLKSRREYGYITRLGSHVYFHGLAEGETNRVEIEDGKTLVIKYLGKSELNPDGTRNVFFELNGIRREVSVQDKSAKVTVESIPMADPNDLSHVGASIPGLVSKILVKQGEKVKRNQVLAVVEAMKMETNVIALMDGEMDQILVKEGKEIKAGELLMTVKTVKE